MGTQFTVHGSDSKCPICGVEEGCYDGLRQGSEIKCGNCGTVMRVDGQEWCKYRQGLIPVFSAQVLVTGAMLRCLRRCRVLPQVPKDGRERLSFEALRRRGLVEHFGPFIGYEARIGVANQLRAMEAAQ